MAILGCYKDFCAIAHMRSLCRSEGFLDVEFNYLGGLWVLFEFLSQDAMDKFIKHEGILSKFSSLKPWHDDIVVDELTKDGDSMSKYEDEEVKIFKGDDAKSDNRISDDKGDDCDNGCKECEQKCDQIVLDKLNKDSSNGNIDVEPINSDPMY
nr:reverse transcriptase domain, reverse transcriptase zinc-binding domain protein [Tanacetum cinerariifolium]